MSFLPLVIFVIGYSAIVEYEEHNREMDGREPISAEGMNFHGAFFYIGIAVLFIAGCLK